MLPRTRAIPLCWLLAGLLFAVNIYRAAAQSITTDEAFTYTRSVEVRIPELWKQFDANDHVLHTLLCKVTRRWFGASEFSLRMPALAGGLLYLVMALRLCAMATSSGWGLLLAYALLVLNPVMLDYCSIARGYGMATSLVMLGLYQAMRWVAAPAEQWRGYAVSLSLAFAVTANLTVVVPATAIVLALAGCLLAPPMGQRQWPRLRERLGVLLDRVVVPPVVITTVVLLVPLLPAKRVDFYVGSKTLADAAESLVYACLWRPYHPLEHTVLRPVVEKTVIAISPWVAVVILVCAVVALVRRRTVVHGMLLAATAGSVALLVGMHLGAGVLYPERRTGLYLLPLFTLLGVTAAGALPRAVRAAMASFAVVCVVLFVTEWNVRFYDEWAFDADNREVMRYIKERLPKDGRKVTVGATFPFAKSVEYYRRIWRMEGLAPAKEGAEGEYDVYVLAADQGEWVGKHGLTVRRRFPFGVTVATRGWGLGR